MGATSALIEALQERAVQGRFESIDAFLGRDSQGDRAIVVSEPLPMHRAIVAWHRIDARASTEPRIGAVLVEPLAWEELLAEPSAEPELPSIAAFRPELRADARRRLTEVAEQLRAMLPTGQTLEALAPRFDLDALAAWENGEKLGFDALVTPDQQEEPEDDEDEDEDEGRAASSLPSGGLRLEPSLYAPNTSERAVLQGLGSRAGSVHLVAFDAPATEAFELLGFGAFNDCPPPAVHAMHFRQWNERHHARPLLLGPATIDAVLSRPPTTVDDAIELVATQLAYAPDTVADSFAVALLSVLGCGGWGFYWD